MFYLPLILFDKLIHIFHAYGLTDLWRQQCTLTTTSSLSHQWRHLNRKILNVLISFGLGHDLW